MTNFDLKLLRAGSPSFAQKHAIDLGFQERGKKEAIAHARALVRSYAGLNGYHDPQSDIRALQGLIAKGQLVKRVAADTSWNQPHVSSAARGWFRQNIHPTVLEAIKQDPSVRSVGSFQDLLYADIGVARWATKDQPNLSEVITLLTRLFHKYFKKDSYRNVWEFVHRVEAGLPHLQRRTLLGTDVGYGTKLTEGFFRGINLVKFGFYEAMVVALRDSSDEAFSHYFLDLETYHIAPSDLYAWNTRGEFDWEKVGRALWEAREAVKEAGLTLSEATLQQVSLKYCEARLPARLFRVINQDGRKWQDFFDQKPKPYQPPVANLTEETQISPPSPDRLQELTDGFLARIPDLKILRTGLPSEQALKKRADEVVSNLRACQLREALSWWRKAAQGVDVQFHPDLHFYEYQVLDFALSRDRDWGSHYAGIKPFHHAQVRPSLWRTEQEPRWEHTRKAIGLALHEEVANRLGRAKAKSIPVFIEHLKRLLGDLTLEKASKLRIGYESTLGINIFYRNASIIWQDLIYDALEHFPYPRIRKHMNDFPTDLIPSGRRLGQSKQIPVVERTKFLTWFEEQYQTTVGRDHVKTINEALRTDLLGRYVAHQGPTQRKGYAAIVVAALREHPDPQVAQYYRHLRTYHVAGAKVAWKEEHYPNWSMLDAVTWETLQMLSARELGIDLHAFEDPDFRIANPLLIVGLEPLIPKASRVLLGQAPLRYQAAFPPNLCFGRLHAMGIAAGHLVAHALTKGKETPDEIKRYFNKRGLNDIPIIQQSRTTVLIQS